MKSRRFWLGVLIGGVAVVVIATAVAVSGVIPMGADGRVNFLDWMGNIMWESSVNWRAPDTENPLAGDKAAFTGGFEGYKSMCVHCHGAPGVAHAGWVSGMHPMPPELTNPEVQERTDGELFHIIAHGVRMTGMPPFGDDHSDEELWQLVAFLRSMDQLTSEQKQQLMEAVGGDHHSQPERPHEHQQAAPSASEGHSEPPHTKQK